MPPAVAGSRGQLRGPKRAPAAAAAAAAEGSRATGSNSKQRRRTGGSVPGVWGLGRMALPLLGLLCLALAAFPFGTWGQPSGVGSANSGGSVAESLKTRAQFFTSGLGGLGEQLGAGLSGDGAQLRTWLNNRELKGQGMAAAQAQSAPADIATSASSSGSASSESASAGSASIPKAKSSSSSAGGNSSQPSTCLPYKDSALEHIERALRASLEWIVQPGYVDFGFLGDDVPECDGNCAFSNPMAPYGLTLLPLAPYEAQRKAYARSTPKGVANELRGSGSVVAPSLANSSASSKPGFAPIYQLLPQEVVLVAGCAPVAEASTYFSATPYLHTAWSEKDRKWVTIFGSMGDSASTIRPEQVLPPGANLSSVASIIGISNFTNSSAAAAATAARGAFRNLPTPQRVAAGRNRLASFTLRPPLMGQLMLQAAAGWGGLGAGLGAGAGGLLGSRWSQLTGGGGIGAGAMAQAAPGGSGGLASSSRTGSSAASGDSSSNRGSEGGQGEEPQPSTSFDQFFVAAMTASPAAAAALGRVLQPTLDALNGGGSGIRARINVLPIPGPVFGDGLGLEPRDSYYMMMLRSIVPAGALASYFRPYAQTQPLRAWRLTPITEFSALPAGPLVSVEAASSGGAEASPGDATAAATATGAGGGLLGLARLGSRAGSPQQAAAAAAATLSAPDLPLVALANDLFAMPDVVPRKVMTAAPAPQPPVVAASPKQQPAFAAAATTPTTAGDLQQLVPLESTDAASPAATSAPATTAAPAPAAVRSMAGPAAEEEQEQHLQPMGNRTAEDVSAIARRAGASGRGLPAAAEAWLEPAFVFLQQRVQQAYEENYAQAWSLATGSYLGSLDPPIDWGLQCAEQMIDYCNGDNRDVTYLSAFPYVVLSRPNAMALVVGVNHVLTGTAKYISIALSDTAQRLGLEAFDGTELYGSAHPYLAGTPYESAAPYLFVIMFARNCMGMPFCKDIPSEGPRSAPMSRNLLATLRAYVNPATGVGPDADDLLKFITVNLVGKADARPLDYRARPQDPLLFARDGCASALIGQILCAQGPDDACCRQVQKWSDTGCWCLDTGKALMQALGPVQGRAMLSATARLCRATRPAINMAEC